MKLELIEWLSKLKDKGLVTSLLQFKKATEAEDWHDTLTDEQRAAIEEGEADLKVGRVISSEEFWAKHGRASEG